MSNRPTIPSYDVVDRAGDMLPRQHVQVMLNPSNLGIVGTLLGTVAADADLCQLFTVPANTNIKVTGASIRIKTGGTAAGTTATPNWGLAYSAASLLGTGARTTFCTLRMGTRGDGSWANFSVTETAVATGNIIHLTSIAGTDTDGSEIADWVVLEYREDWT